MTSLLFDPEPGETVAPPIPPAPAAKRRRRRDRTTQHTAMVDAIHHALGREPDMKLWTNPVKVVPALLGGQIVHLTTGLAPGSADLVGILRPWGRWFALEVKTGGADLEPHQRLWHALIRDMGGFTAVVRSVDEARAALGRARRGLAA